LFSPETTLQLSNPDSYLSVLLILAVAPSIYLLWFFYNQDRYRHESKKLLAVTFLLGALMIIPAIILEAALKFLFPPGDTLVGVFLYFLLEVALIEESLKFFAVRVYAYNSRMFVEPMDGLILGVAAALGFATVENILYVVQNGIYTAVIRAIISVPSHALYGAIFGFYLGEAKFRKRPSLALRGLLFAIVLHAIFDSVATVLPSIIGVIVLVAFVLVLYYRVVKGEIREAEAESPFRPRGLRMISQRFERRGIRFGCRMINIAFGADSVKASGPLAQPGRALGVYRSSSRDVDRLV
jgi:RsiW-degrading membrane proteinase PrsW (M82 family)